MEEFKRYVKKTLLQLAGMTFFLPFILLVADRGEYISGWLIGCGLNLLYFLMLCTRSVRALRQTPEQAFVVLRGGAFIRLLMIILMLIIVLQFPSINFWAVLAGILTYRLLIYFDALCQFIRIRRQP